MIKLTNDGKLCFSHASFDHRLAVRVDTGDATWTHMPLQGAGETTYTAHARQATVNLELTKTDTEWQYSLRADSDTAVRVQLALELPGAADPYPIIPAVIFGDNNLHHIPDPIFPHLTGEPREEPNCAPYWECRADRASHPAALTSFNGGIAAISVSPYCDDAQGITGGDNPDFVRNGLFARVAHEDQPDACGVTLGYRNTPCTYVCKNRFDPPTEHRLQSATVCGSIHLADAADRLAVNAVIRRLHSLYREPPETGLSDQRAMQLLTDAFVNIGWVEDGKNFADMKWDFNHGELAPFRGPNDEIAWTGGTQTAFPLLVSGYRYDHREAVDKALTVLDRIGDPDSINPESGWLWDVCRADGTRTVHGWWTGGSGERHCAYTNGEAASYLLQAYKFARDEMQLDRSAWRDTALRVLENAMGVQTAQGNFGYTYSANDGSIADPEGFAGCWFNAALATAYELTGESRYLDSAARGMDYYHRFVRELWCWGTPMDTRKAVDQEGILAFIRAARLLHQTTGEQRYLDMLEQGAEYEYLWRFVIRARPQEPPLKNSTWNSCGGSITSTSNPHIHPMGILVSGDLAYLAEQTGDNYHRQRLREGLDWALNSLELYPDQTDYGHAGILTERFCPSDGLLTEQYPDGSPASVWFTYHVWGAANVLEGLLG